MENNKWTKEFPRRVGAYFLRWPDGRQEIAQCAVTTPAIMGEFGGEDFCVADGAMSVSRAGSTDLEPDYVFEGAEWLGPISPESFEHEPTDPRDMTDDELSAEIRALESRLYTLKAEGSKAWRLRLRTNNAVPADHTRLDQLHKRRAASARD